MISTRWSVQCLANSTLITSPLYCFIGFYLDFFFLNMSWIKMVSQSSDDVFDEQADELKLQSKEWNTMIKKRIKVEQTLPNVSAST